MPNRIRVLILEDKVADAELMVHELKVAGFEPEWQRVDEEPGYLAGLEADPDLILADWSLPQFSGWRALQILQERKLEVPFIIVSGSMGEDIAVDALHAGAADYLLKDRITRLGEAARRAIEANKNRENNKRMEEALADSERKFRNLVEQSSDGIVIINEQGLIVDWNRKQEQITGIKQEAVLGQPLWELQYQMVPTDIKNPLMMERFKKAITNLLDTGQTPRYGQEAETIIQLPDGTQRTVQMTIYQFKTEKGFMAGGIFHDITARKLAEEKVTESELRYRRLFEASKDGILILDDESGVIKDVNPFLIEMLGISREDICGKELWELGFFKDVAANKAHFLELQQKSYIRFDDLPLETSNGRKFQVEFISNVYLVNQHKVIQCNIRDITKRKQAEEKLRKERILLETVINNLPDHIYAMDVQGHKTLSNEADWRASGGKSMKEVIGKTDMETYPPELAEKYWTLDKAVIDSGNSINNQEEPGLDSRGNPVWLLSSKVPLRDDQGNIIGLVGIGRDITERKQVEEAMRQSEAELRALFASMHEVVMVIDREGVYRKFAPTNPEMLIKPPEDLLGKSLINVFPKEQAELFMGAIQEVLETKQPTQIDYALPFGDRIVNFEASIMPLMEGSTLWVARDITSRKLAEEKIIQLNAELEQRVVERTRQLRQAQDKIARQEKLAMLGQLAGSVGHELRNPLGIISSGIYYLKLIQPDADERVKKYHAMIEQEVWNSEKIVTDLLDFARLESMEKEPMAVSELVPRTLLRFPVPELVKTTLHLPADLPRVFADTRQMEQVLGNLIVNAYQAMLTPRGTSVLRSPTGAGKLGELTILAKMQKGMVGIAVKDTGIGITPENMGKLFEPLFTTKSKGIGLGLAVSRKLAEANGGRIEVKSEPGKGSTFTLFLPTEVK